MKIILENKQEIIDAVNAGKQVFCGNKDYKVIKDRFNGQYLIEYRDGKHYTGLSGQAGTKYENSLNIEGEYYFEEPCAHKMYLDWVNNFLSFSKFADHYKLPILLAAKIIQEAKKSHVKQNNP